MKKKNVQSITSDLLEIIEITSATLYGLSTNNMYKHALRTLHGNYSDTYIKKGIQRLSNHGYIENLNDSFLISPKGKRVLASYRSKRAGYFISKKWDGKWRIIIFDIEEKHRHIRNQVRKEIKNIGFVQLQQSVWIFPYPCEKYINLLKHDVYIMDSLVYIITERIEREDMLMKHFKLKRS